MELQEIRRLVDDLDGLLGLQGNFWQTSKEHVSTTTLETPEQLEELFGDLLVKFFGLKVEGLP